MKALTSSVPSHSQPSCYKDCAEMLSSQHAKEKADNRHILYKILSNVQFLVRQGLPLRGSRQGDDSNFIHFAEQMMYE